MKKIFFLLLLLPLMAMSQQDSGKIKVTVIIKGKDCKFISNFMDASNRFDDLDSVMKAAFRVANSPANNDDVTITNIRLERISWINNVYQRLDAVLRAAGQTWIIGKLDADAAVDDNYYTNLLQQGNLRLKKQLLD